MRTIQDYKFLAVQQHELISRLLADQKIDPSEIRALYKTGAGVFAEKELNHLLKMAENFEYSHEAEAPLIMARKQHF